MSSFALHSLCFLVTVNFTTNPTTFITSFAFENGAITNAYLPPMQVRRALVIVSSREFGSLIVVQTAADGWQGDRVLGAQRRHRQQTVAVLL